MKWTDVMGLLGGLALFLYGMQMMSQGLENAAGNKMKQILGKLTSNRFLGVVVGAVITAVIQSSSATTVMVVGFVNSGLMTLDRAAFILFGQNIGTCITALLAAIGANRNAKRTTVVHFSFNIIGTFLFAILCVVTPLIHWMQSISPDNVPAQIANLHTLFNIVTTILLLPFGQVLATIAKKILPDRERAKGWKQCV